MTKSASITQAQIKRAVSAARAIDPKQPVEIVLPSGVVLRFPAVGAETDKGGDEWEKAFD